MWVDDQTGLLELVAVQKKMFFENEKKKNTM